jgi:pSer/pThr/pTyr-binding forkhead associated (FHA) protein
MPVKLIELGPEPGQKREILAAKDEFLIGRGADCDLRLNAVAISRHHCLMRLRGDDVVVLDLGSSNGTFVNGQRVRSQATLHDGDQLSVGAVDFQVEIANESIISWCLESAADQSAVTFKLKAQPGRVENDSDKEQPPGSGANLGK